MPFLRPVLAALLLAVVLPGARAGAAETVPLPRTVDWIEARTEHFTVYSDTGAPRARKTVIQLERFRSALARITRGFELDDRVPTSTFLFRNDRSFSPYNRDRDGNEQHISGYFMPRPFENLIALDASAGAEPMRVVFHEYFHAVMDASLGTVPLWLNEGLADYFSTFRDRKGSTVVEAGHPIESHLATLAEGPPLPWTEVFDTTFESSTYHGGRRQGAFYARSWLLVHYLNADDDRARALGRYLSLLRSGVDDETAFVQAFEKCREAVAADAEAYLEKGTRHVWWDLGDDLGDVAATVREVTPAEVTFRLGRLLAQSGRVDDATVHLDAAREAGWPAPEVDAARGVLARIAGDPTAAERAFRRAVDADVRSAEPYVLLAELWIERAGEALAGEAPPRETPPLMLEARRLAERGVALEPRSFPALYNLARTYLVGTPHVEAGILALRRARELRPLSPDLSRVEAALLARSGRVTEAGAMVARDIEPRNPSLVPDAERAITDGAILAAVDRLDADDRAGARRILADAVAAVGEPSLSSELRSLQLVVESGGRIVLHAPDETGDPAADAVARYNEAVGLASANRQREALEILDSLAEECVVADICRLARDHGAELRSLLERNRLITMFNQAVELANAGRRRDAIAQLEQLRGQTADAALLAEVDKLLKGLGAKRGRGKR